MTVRDEFEAWQNQTHDKYGDWPLWQAAYAAGQESMRAKLDEQWNDGFDKGKAAGRKAGLEEAARIVDDFRGPIELYNKQYPAFLDCAAAIRALKEEK
jgi:hypothetical protein